MKNNFIVVSLLLMSLNLYAELPSSYEAIKVIKKKDAVTYKNIPRILKHFKGERNSTDTSSIEKECQEWAFSQIQDIKKNVFRVWCTKSIDVVLRQHVYSANILIKNWNND